MTQAGCPRKAIIIGASSGIGRALAKVLAREGYEVGLAARRLERLRELQTEIPSRTWTKMIDVRNPEETALRVNELIAEMGGLDLAVINAGVSIPNPDLELAPELDTVRTNVEGFVAAANAAVRHFLRQKSGHLVGISSIAALYASGNSPAYCASKSFVSNYLAGLGQRLSRTRVRVTDIRPGFVDTPMVRGRPHVFWAAPAGKAAEQIFQAIQKNKRAAYVTKRWALAAFLIRCVPAPVFNWFYYYSYTGHLGRGRGLEPEKNDGGV